MATCDKCGTDYTNRGGPSLECDCGRKVDLGRIGQDDQASAVMVDAMRAATERMKNGDIAGLCALAFGIGSAMRRAGHVAKATGFRDAAEAVDSLFQLVRNAMESGYKGSV